MSKGRLGRRTVGTKDGWSKGRLKQSDSNASPTHLTENPSRALFVDRSFTLS